MNSGRFDLLRSFVFSLAIAASAIVLAQPGISFEALDRDGSGSLSRGEFSRLPGFAGSPDLFVDLDTNHDRVVSGAEWMAGSPDERGIPIGSVRAAVRRIDAGAIAAARPASTQHGPNVPIDRETVDPRTELPPPLERGRLSASPVTKRGMSATPPPQAAFPTPGEAGPPK